EFGVAVEEGDPAPGPPMVGVSVVLRHLSLPGLLPTRRVRDAGIACGKTVPVDSAAHRALSRGAAWLGLRRWGARIRARGRRARDRPAAAAQAAAAAKSAQRNR